MGGLIAQIIMKQCTLCEGTGIVDGIRCEVCHGKGEVEQCLLCSSPITSSLKIKICESCEENHEIVLELDSLSGYSDIILGKSYLGKIKRIGDVGYFVALNTSISGLIRRRDVTKKYMLNQEVVVKAESLRDNRLDFIPLNIEKYTLIPIKKDIPLWKINDITDKAMNGAIMIHGIVSRVQRTSGPTIFSIYDETGAIECAAFARGQRAYPAIDVENVVEVRGEVSLRQDKLQIEVRDMEKLYGSRQSMVRDAIDKFIEEEAAPSDIPLLVASPVGEELREKMLLIAKELRKAVYKGIPILIRHHADCDGFIGGIALDIAIRPLLREHSPDKEAEWHLFRRSPSRAPFYEMEDVVRDLNYAHEDASRFGQSMPLVLIIDNGSTREDMPAIRKFKVYGSKILVVDHHYPGEVKDGKVEVDELVDIHVNPYLVGGDYTFTAGCQGVEIARLINPEISEKIKHLPGIACSADRAKSEIADAYINIAMEKGYTQENMLKIAECVDFEAFYLRFMDGKTLVEDFLGLGRLDRQRNLLEVVGSEVERLREQQLKTVLVNAKSVKLANNLLLSTLDLDQYSHKFTYPPPGKTTGMLHDIKAKENSKRRTVTLAYGPDFVILRATEDVSRDMGLNVNIFVKELSEELPQAGIDGGGHEVAGSIKFVEGYRKPVLEKLAEKVAKLKA